MNDALTPIVVALNAVANGLGWLLGWIGWLPGFWSLTLSAVLAGALLLLIFKYTSNQTAIKKVRRGIRANLLAVRLFKDNFAVGLRAQGLVIVGAFKLLLLAIVPIIVMLIPVTLLLGQLSLWYQARPIAVDEEIVVTVKLAGKPGDPFPSVALKPNDAVEDALGPIDKAGAPAEAEIKGVRVFSQREVCWNLRGKTSGQHKLTFVIDGQPYEKELAVGKGFMRVSPRKPAWDWSDAVLYPREKPFGAQATVRSIEIDYPTRPSWIYGGSEKRTDKINEDAWAFDSWLIYWFVVSLVAAFCLRGVLKVSL